MLICRLAGSAAAVQPAGAGHTAPADLLASYCICIALRSEWPYEKPVVEVKRRKPKGHKHDREKPQRCGAGGWGGAAVCPKASLDAGPAGCSTSMAWAPTLTIVSPSAGILRCRQAEIAKQLEMADKRIAEYRVRLEGDPRENRRVSARPWPAAQGAGSGQACSPHAPLKLGNRPPLSVLAGLAASAPEGGEPDGPDHANAQADSREGQGWLKQRRY